MQSFTLYLKNDLKLTVKGNNLIDACLRSGDGIDHRQIKSYQENDGDTVIFSK